MLKKLLIGIWNLLKNFWHTLETTKCWLPSCDAAAYFGEIPAVFNFAAKWESEKN